MATDFKSLPVIDIAPLLLKCDDPDMTEDAGVAEVVRQLDRACRHAGFFYVIGHGISENLIKKAREITREFFKLPYEDKLKIKMTPSAGYRGYQRIGENVTKGKPDIHEAIDCYREFKQGKYGDLGKPMEGLNQWPEIPQEFRELMEEYTSLCTDLSRKILRGIALALKGSPYEFEGKIAGEPFWVMRLIGYPGDALVTNGQPKNDIGCGAHTDYGLLTLVNQDDDKTALQVRNLCGDWISAVPIPGSIVCNIGDMLKILSNGVYESTLHRVINNSPLYRVCVAFFYETNFDAVVEPLDVCKEKYPSGRGEAQVFKRAVYGEHLVSKVHTLLCNETEMLCQLCNNTLHYWGCFVCFIIWSPVDLMISGSRPVSAVTYLSDLKLSALVFALPSSSSPPEKCGSLCLAYMEAMWNLIQTPGLVNLSGEQTRLALYAALVLPFRKMVYKNNRGKLVPVVNYIFKVSMKRKSSEQWGGS